MSGVRVIIWCDGCGVTLGEGRGPATASGFVDASMEAKDKANGLFKAMTLRRNYRRTRHYCQCCADGNSPQLSDKWHKWFQWTTKAYKMAKK
jgi:hypothetical protein